MLRQFPARLDDAMLAIAERISVAALPALPAADPELFGKFMRTMATLPRRKTDDVSGDVTLKLYFRQLRHLPNEALSFIASEATSTCQWFPTIAECLAIAERWIRNDDAVRAKRYAAAIAVSEREARFRDLKIAILKGEVSSFELGGLPHHTKLMLDNQNLIRVGADGEVTLRNIEDGEREFMLWRLEREGAAT